MQQYLIQYAAPSFWIGAIAGVVASAIVQRFGAVLATMMSVVVENVSTSPSVRGKWRTTFQKEGGSFHEDARVFQLFQWVWGDIDYYDKDLKYHFRGTVRQRILVATYEVKGRGATVLDRGAFTLQLDFEGDKLSGRYSWTDSESNAPAADRYEWAKKKK
jgi:hypothetical protein